MTKKVIVFIFTILFSISAFVQSDTTYANYDCLALTSSSSAAMKSYCQNELAEIEAELAHLLELQKKQQAQTGTLIGDVNYLQSQINALKTKIQARSRLIAELKVAITEKVSTINSLNKKIEREHESIAQLIRNTNEFDNKNLLHLILSDQSISAFYGDLESYASIKKAVKASVDNIRGIKTETEVAKTDLEKKQDAEADAKAELEYAHQKISVTEKEKKQLLAISKNQEAEYKKLADAKKAEIDRIKSALIQFQGSGIENRKISFGEAYEYAKQASAKTGVRTALILAIMQQETGFGRDFGGCYVTDLTTGDGKGKTSGIFYEKVMGSGSLSHFSDITKSLGLSWETTPVSCPIDLKKKGTATVYYEGRGFGGAMGYTQFIPSTWVLVEARVRSYLGVATANPWDPRHAVTATAVFLQDLGAAKRTFSAEYNAACRYFGSCSSYAPSVMNKATLIQLDIDKIEGL